jgi:hypothetical protein
VDEDWFPISHLVQGFGLTWGFSRGLKNCISIYGPEYRGGLISKRNLHISFLYLIGGRELVPDLISGTRFRAHLGLFKRSKKLYFGLRSKTQRGPNLQKKLLYFINLVDDGTVGSHSWAQILR